MIRPTPWRVMATDAPRIDPSRSGSRAPKIRTARTANAYSANTSPELSRPTWVTYSGTNAENPANPVVDKARITPGRSAAGWRNRRLAFGSGGTSGRAFGMPRPTNTATKHIAALRNQAEWTPHVVRQTSPSNGPMAKPPYTATEKYEV